MSATLPESQNHQSQQTPTWLDSAIMGKGVLGAAFSACAGLYCVAGLVAETAAGVVSDRAADRVHDAFFGKDM